MNLVLQAWLHSAAQHPASSRDWVLRGSILTQTLCQNAGLLGSRAPMDVDYLVLHQSYKPKDVERWALEVAKLPNPFGQLEVVGCETIWANTPYPGGRVFVQMQHPDGRLESQIDFAYDDPMTLEPRLMQVAGIPALVCAPESLVAWKAHGLVEFGRGRWRAKDVYDLALLCQLPLEPAAVLPALELAYTSRGNILSDLDDFLGRESWGLSLSGQRKWRHFQRKQTVTREFLACREVVKAFLKTVL
jgi:hypothetical protein